VTDVARIETVVIDPPTLRTAEVTAAVRALSACGDLPKVATVDELRAAVARAGDELGRAAEVWRRYSRRYGHPHAPIDHAPSRLIARYHVACQLFDQRVEVVCLLVDGPPGGSA